MATYIDKIGVELEVAISLDEETGDYPEIDRFEHVSDGSLNTRGTSHSRTREYVSDPIDYDSKWDNEEMSQLEAGIWKLYNRYGVETNSSMGMHVHVSFNKEYYRRALASQDFIDYFTQEIKDSELYDEYERLQDRLRGTNSYAQPTNPQDIQRSMNSPGSTRYRHFTYRGQTIEFRLFPGFDSDLDVRRAINLLTSIINSYLYNKKHEFEETGVVEVKDDEKIPDKQKVTKDDLEEVLEYV